MITLLLISCLPIVMVVWEILSYLKNENYTEVETPMMHVIPGGATARPFTTHHNSLDMELFLRIAPELYLKRLVVGGFEKVFEINRSFRNEGLSPRHNPEFTMLEFYQAYSDYEDLMDLTEDMMRKLTSNLFDSNQVSYQDETYDLEKPFNGKLIDRFSLLPYTPVTTVNSLPALSNFIISSLMATVVTHPSCALQCEKGKLKIFFLSI